MIYAYVHNGQYHGWYEINNTVYDMIRNAGVRQNMVGRNKIIILPTITCVLKVKAK